MTSLLNMRVFDHTISIYYKIIWNSNWFLQWVTFKHRILQNCPGRNILRNAHISVCYIIQVVFSLTFEFQYVWSSRYDVINREMSMAVHWLLSGLVNIYISILRLSRNCSFHVSYMYGLLNCYPSLFRCVQLWSESCESPPQLDKSK